MNGIYILKEDGSLVTMTETPYDSEVLLQKLLAQHPDLLAGNEITPHEPRRWLLVAREAGIPDRENGNGRWSLDHLFLDQDGVPTLVEVKRSSDTRIRREVVGQMLDYAANAVAYWPVETIQIQFAQTCMERKEDSEETLMNFLGLEGNAEKFWQDVKTNLQAGRIRMLFVADIIPDELRRIVEFLNQQMDPAEVLALEIRQYAGQALKTLVPRIIGQTAEAERRKSSSPSTAGQQWNEQAFFEQLAQQGKPAEEQVARRLLEWGAKRVTRVWWGKGKANGSFVPVLEHGGVNHQAFAVYTGPAKGSAVVEIYFYWYSYKPPFNDRSKRLELLEKLNSIPGVFLPESAVDRRPNITLDILSKDDRLETFLGAMNWYLDEIQKS